MTGTRLYRAHEAPKPFFVAILALGSVWGSVLGSGCATTGTRVRTAEDADSLKQTSARTTGDEGADEGLGGGNGTPRGVSARFNRGELVVNGMKLKNTQFDYPITINSRTLYWIDYFTGRGRGHFERYLERSEHFIPFIVPILRQNGVPEDLVYLAMIESGFNNHARSHAKAVGPWQFISATGKRYGLMVNWWVDERRDTRKSTQSAIEYLKDLYSIFQNWELASAAYNAGESKIARAVRRYGTKDFWVLARHRFLRPETRDYVPKIIAAALIAKNREQFGFKGQSLHPGEHEVISGDGEVVKVETEAESLAKGEAPAQGADGAETIQSVILSAETLDSYEESPDAIVPASLPVREGADVASGTPLAKVVPTPTVNKKGEVSGEELMEFELQSPADLLKVARAAGLSYQTVKALNPELLRWCTPPTVGSYRVKLPSSVKDMFLATYNGAGFPRKVQFLTYKVRSGDTLSRVSRHFGIKVDPIVDLNGVSPKAPLRSGLHVMLPMPNDRTRAMASLDVRDPPELRKRKGRRYSAKYYKVSYKKREAARARRGDGT